MQKKLRALHARLQKAQRDLLIRSAETHALPPDGVLRKIADLECAIGAIELMLEETIARPSNGSGIAHSANAVA